jgi:hypothetical protein
MEELPQYEHHVFHRGVVVVVKDDFITSRLLRVRALLQLRVAEQLALTAALTTLTTAIMDAAPAIMDAAPNTALPEML